VIGVRRAVVLVGLVALAAAAACGGAASPEPVAWERLVPAGMTGEPGAVVRVDDRFVAFFEDGTWTSSDGRDWSPEAVDAGEVLDALGQLRWNPFDDPAPSGDLTNRTVVATAAREATYVAVGTEWGAGQRPGAWFASANEGWTSCDPLLEGSGARDVVATPDGFAAAGAANAAAGEATHARFWQSTDGRAWTAVPEAASFANAEPQAMAVRDDRIVAVGPRMTADGFAPMAWWSDDGLSWNSAELDAAMAWWPAALPSPVQGTGALQGTVMWAVAAVDGGFVAAGTRSGLEPQRPESLAWQLVVWTSVDGRTWRILPEDAGFDLGVAGSMQFGPRAIATSPDVTLIAGQSDDGFTVWRTEGSLLAMP
jgi:hypothetical protein